MEHVRGTHRLQPRVKAEKNHRARFDRIRPYVEGKTVLDIGAACGMSMATWLHRLVNGVAARTVAVDILPEPVQAIQEAGFEAVQGDAQALDLGEKFDVVLAGELIEHLDNLAGFLESATRHLNPGGLLVLTTPNAMCLTNFVYRLGSGKAPLNEEHVLWFDEDTLWQLLNRSGWHVVEQGFVEHDTPGRARALVAGAVRAVLPPRLAWNTLFCVAEPPG
jgi:2-polyprenyl-3-methyl-5-hydroxy-6-metoxy-1,4-benzoquinol methylase